MSYVVIQRLSATSDRVCLTTNVHFFDMKNSLKDKVRYWFEFLNLAHQSHDPIIANNLYESLDYYSRWGNYRTIKFALWWRENSSLFRDEDADVLSSLQVGDVVTDDAFYVRIPYTYSPSTVGKIVSEKFARELAQRSVRTKKVKRIYGGAYSLTREDYPVAKFKYYLIFVRDVYLPLLRDSKRLKSADWLALCRKVFIKVDNRVNSAERVPFVNNQSSDDSDARLLRRYRQMSEKLLRNVSSGVFPGGYEESFVRTQAEIRAMRTFEATKMGANAKRGARLGNTKMKKLVNADDPFSQRKTRSDKGKKRSAYVTSKT